MNKTIAALVFTGLTMLVVPVAHADNGDDQQVKRFMALLVADSVPFDSDRVFHGAGHDVCEAIHQGRDPYPIAASIVNGSGFLQPSAVQNEIDRYIIDAKTVYCP